MSEIKGLPLLNKSTRERVEAIWDSGFIGIGNMFVDLYLQGKINEEKIVKYSGWRGCLYECYLILIRKRELVPIEAMTDTEKSDLWNECKKYCEPLSKDDRIKFVKAYAALSCLMKKRL